MTRDEIEVWAEEMDVPLVFLDGYDDAIIGVVEGKLRAPCVLYDQTKIIDILCDDGMTFTEAVEYLAYNVTDAYVGEHTPMFLLPA